MGNGASLTVCGGAPETSLVFNFPSSKKPKDRLSGPQKKDHATRSSRTNFGVTESIGRTYVAPLLATSLAAAIQRPSGETVTGDPPAAVAVSGINEMTKWTSSGSGAPRK